MIKKLIGTTLLSIVCVFANRIAAQALYEVPVNEKVLNATLIAEGEVVEQTGFWNEGHTMIYTANRIKVYKVFKGSTTEQFIDIVTSGGVVGNRGVQVSELLELNKGQVGIFFCYPNASNLRSPLNNKLLFDVYASAQGFYNIDTYTGKASAPFVQYNSVINELYPQLQQLVGTSFKVIDPSFKADINLQTQLRTNAPVIASFSPATVDAGATMSAANNQLTINGTGFGSAGGSAAVTFDDANDGTGGTPWVVSSTDNLIISWTDTQIKLRVPSRAGTGTITVRDASGFESASGTPLTVRYSIITQTFSSVTKQMNLMDDNAFGGYTIFYGSNITGTAAQTAFQRALTTWIETVGFAVFEGGSTATNTASGDNINVVARGALPAGVLAVCYSYSSTCAPASSFEFQKTEFDIIITTATSGFETGPCPPITSNIDMESVILHELGHAINLGHINDPLQGGGENNPAKMMHYAITNGVKRTSPDYSSYVGALYCVAPRMGTYGSCGLAAAEMTQQSYTVVANDDCPTFPVAFTPSGTVAAFNLVHATSNKFSDPQFTAINCSSTGVAVTNTQFLAIRTQFGGTLNLSVSGYSTTPVAQQSCGTAGVELAVYAVSSCPAGQAFPAPIACRTFNGDGAITSITGLAANTTYLIMCDGIANTKAAFNLTLTGGVLPIKFTSFTGEIKGNYNQLNWTTEFIQNVSSIVIERSKDGNLFETIGEIKGSVVYNRSNSFNDAKPIVGNNYYRLKIINSDGSVEFSSIVLLKRSDKFLFTLTPNPAVSFVDIQISSEIKGNYNVVLYNMTGQAVMSKSVNVNSGRNTTRMDVGNIAKGLYQVVVYDENKNRVKTNALNIQ